MQLCNGPFQQKENLIWLSLIDLDAILEVYTPFLHFVTAIDKQYNAKIQGKLSSKLSPAYA